MDANISATTTGDKRQREYQYQNNGIKRTDDSRAAGVKLFHIDFLMLLFPTRIISASTDYLPSQNPTTSFLILQSLKIYKR